MSYTLQDIIHETSGAAIQKKKKKFVRLYDVRPRCSSKPGKQTKSHLKHTEADGESLT